MLYAAGNIHLRPVGREFIDASPLAASGWSIRGAFGGVFRGVFRGAVKSPHPATANRPLTGGAGSLGPPRIMSPKQYRDMIRRRRPTMSTRHPQARTSPVVPTRIPVVYSPFLFSFSYSISSVGMLVAVAGEWFSHFVRELRCILRWTRRKSRKIDGFWGCIHGKSRVSVDSFPGNAGEFENSEC